MPAVLNRIKLGALVTGGALLLMASAGASAALLTFSASQGGKHTVLSSDLGVTVTEGDLADRNFGAGLNIPRYVPSLSNSVAAERSSFLSGLSDVQTRTFEAGDAATAATVNPSSVGTTVDGEDPANDGLLSAGRYNVTGILQGSAVLRSDAGHWYEDAYTFTLTVPTGTNALGFFGIDVGDFAGSLALELLDANGQNIDQSISVPTSSTAGSATLLFFGLHSDTAFASVRFTITQSSLACESDVTECDFLGFDNITTGAIDTGGNGTVPEPGTLALLGLALAGLAATRRRKL